MLKVEDYGKIRRAHRDGMSIREIARTFGRSRRKVREVLAQPQPKPYTRVKEPPAPVLGSFHAAINAILAADEQAPPKQRHTAMQVFRRLRDEQKYAGGYDQVRRYVARQRRDRRETFIPLAHDPGQRLECDFGHIHVDFPDGRRPVPVMVAAWAYSNYAFALAVPTERTEAILAGMVAAFAFFDCVPHEVWWDNPTTVVNKIFRGRDRRPSELYAALASHYTFDPLFCMPARGNEKSYAENRVKVLQKQWATPVPQAAHLDALNAYLRECCLAEVSRPIPSMLVSRRQRRWTSTKPCVSTATATACRGPAPFARSRSRATSTASKSWTAPRWWPGTRAVTAATSRSLSRCTIWPPWVGGRQRWTTPR
jgi:transposase